MKNKHTIVDLSLFSIIKFFLVIIALVFLYMIQDVLAIMFVALILSAAVDPWVDKWEKYRIPRGISILLIYLILFSILFFTVYLLIPPISNEFQQLQVNFPDYYNKATELFTSVQAFSSSHGLSQNSDSLMNSIRNNVPAAISSVLDTVYNIFGSIISFFIILVIGFYFTVEENALKRAVTFFLPRKYNEQTLSLINKVQEKIGSWLVGQLVLCLIIGSLTYIGLTILGVKYALVIALFAAVGEFVPYIGPIISAFPAVFLAFTQSPIKGVLVLILFIVIQQLENNLLVPKVMQKAVGLNPIASMVAMLIGAQLAGVIGIILAIPVATAISVVIKEYWGTKEQIDRLEKDVKQM
jgi:predicted PurR-regulated permease PerM